VRAGTLESDGTRCVSLRVGQTTAQPVGRLRHDGNVEECVSTGTGRTSGSQLDPGDVLQETFASRARQHSTNAEFLPLVHRSGTLPEDNSWLIGFRVVGKRTTATDRYRALHRR